MASTDALPIPRKNTAYRITFPIYDADGDLVTGASGLDSEVSKDAGTFADCTNEATEIATSSGVYYLDLTSTEMNADTVAVIVKTSTSGAKTSVIVMYPEEAGDVRVNVTQISDDATAADNAELMFDGTGYAGGTAKLGVDVVNWKGSTAPAMTGDAYARLGAPVGASISADLQVVDDFLDTEIAAIKAKTDNLPTDPADDSDIDTQLAAIAGYIDTEVAAIKAKTDQLTFTVANQIDANVIDWKGATAPAMTGDAFARLGAPAGASVSADIAAVKVDTAAVLDDTGTSGVVVGQVGIKKNTALAGFTFVMYDETDDITLLDGLTVDGFVSIDGAAFASLTNSVTEVSDGVYTVDLDAADVNGDVIMLKFDATGANSTIVSFRTQV